MRLTAAGNAAIEQELRSLDRTLIQAIATNDGLAPAGLLDAHEHMAECKPVRMLLRSLNNDLQGEGWKKSGYNAINSIAFVASLPINSDLRSDRQWERKTDRCDPRPELGDHSY